jgi:hypothetical protein
LETAAQTFSSPRTQIDRYSPIAITAVGIAIMTISPSSANRFTSRMQFHTSQMMSQTMKKMSHPTLITFALLANGSWKAL